MSKDEQNRLISLLTNNSTLGDGLKVIDALSTKDKLNILNKSLEIVEGNRISMESVKDFVKSTKNLYEYRFWLVGYNECLDVIGALKANKKIIEFNII